jgi:hypothetical protein
MSLSFDDRKRLFIELLDKNMLYVNLCDLDDEEYIISDADKAFTRGFFSPMDLPGALRVMRVAAMHVGQRVFEGGRLAARDELFVPTTRADFGARGEEEFHLRVGKDDGADVPPLEDHAAVAPGGAL